jgi:hypothetical protein
MQRWTCVLYRGMAFVLATLGGVSVLGADEGPFDYFRNSWNVVGLKDYRDGARVTPANEILLADRGVLRFRFGRDLVPLSRKQTKTCHEGWMPVVMLSAKDGPVRYDFRFWATPLPTVKDWQKAFDWPIEGENFLVWAMIDVTNTGAQPAEAKVQVEITWPNVKPEPCPFTWKLAPREQKTTALRVPFSPVSGAAGFDREDTGVWLKRTVDYWKGAMAGAARIEVPCRKATEALLAAHVCQLIANDHGALHGGEGFYDEFYIRDGAYQIMELEEAGLSDAAAKAIAVYLRSQRPDGRFESQSNQFDANGQAVWALWQYGKITGDRAWLERVYPQMRKSVEWTMKARRQAPADSPFAGLLPAAPADGEYLWDGKHHILGYDFWNLRGVLLTADAARTLGKSTEAEELLREANSYREAIDAAWKRLGVPHFPPSWEKEGTHWGNTETLWPTPIFAPDDPRVAALIQEVRHRHGGGFVEGTIRWTGAQDAIHPYMSAYTTMAELVRGNGQQFVEDFYWYLLHSTAAHAFPEGIYFKTRVAWNDTIPHVTGASNYALLLRHMLVHEQGGDLHLLLGVPDGWLGAGQQIRVERAPTHFGPMGMTVRGTVAGVEVEIDRPARQPPTRIVLHLPKSRPLIGKLDGVEVVARPDQTKRWDWAAVVAAYGQQAPHVRPIAGLVELPLGSRVSPENCVTLDLSAVAVTDPFTAPFGVSNPGEEFLFTGMPVGRTVAGGVPFAIIDPAKNAGRGLVVLESPHAPKHVKFPKQVEVPVNQQGRRMFFLGNVHGWSPQDPGAGPWGAVAEYVICYAGGQEQVVPLVTGRTADEWSQPPEAIEVQPVLKGKRWHLNLLGVELRSLKVEKVIFRDLGTPSAPVLVGITVEK